MVTVLSRPYYFCRYGHMVHFRFRKENGKMVWPETNSLPYSLKVNLISPPGIESGRRDYLVVRSITRQPLIDVPIMSAYYKFTGSQR